MDINKFNNALYIGLHKEVIEQKKIMNTYKEQIDNISEDDLNTMKKFKEYNRILGIYSDAKKRYDMALNMIQTLEKENKVTIPM